MFCVRSKLNSLLIIDYSHTTVYPLWANNQSLLTSTNKKAFFSSFEISWCIPQQRLFLKVLIFLRLKECSYSLVKNTNSNDLRNRISCWWSHLIQKTRLGHSKILLFTSSFWLPVTVFTSDNNKLRFDGSFKTQKRNKLNLVRGSICFVTNSIPNLNPL